MEPAILRRPAVRLVLALLGLGVLVLVFLGYQSPGLLLDFLNFNYCG